MSQNVGSFQVEQQQNFCIRLENQQANNSKTIRSKNKELIKEKKKRNSQSQTKCSKNYSDVIAGAATVDGTARHFADK